MTAKTTTFSVRLPAEQYRLLQALAGGDSATPAAMARELIHEGLRRRLDPEWIDHYMEQEKQLLLAAGAELRKRLATP